MTLNKFEDQDVYDAQVRITKTGDGLSAAMEVEPIEIRNRQVGISILEWQCTSNAFDNAKDGDGLVRVAKLATTRGATIMPDEPLYKMLLDRLNGVTSKLAAAGAAKGSQPGQTSVEGNLLGQDGEGDGTEPTPFPTDGSAGPDQNPSGDDLDAELADLTSRK